MLLPVLTSSFLFDDFILLFLSPLSLQVHHPFYMLTEEQRLHIVSRITLIQSLPVGHYEALKVIMSEKKSEKDNTDQARE